MERWSRGWDKDQQDEEKAQNCLYDLLSSLLFGNWTRLEPSLYEPEVLLEE